MKLDKKQVPMLVVLAVLVVGCVGYLSFKMSTPPPSKSANQAVDKATDKAATDDTAATAELEVAAAGVFPDLSATPARRDPFVPQKLPGSELAMAFKQTRLTPTATRDAKPTGPWLPRIELEHNPYASVRPAQPNRIIAVPPGGRDQDQMPEFELTGVVSGDGANVVILRVGKDERHIVREGQTIGGRYTVKSVTSDGLVLISGKQIIPVKLGGNKNAN